MSDISGIADELRDLASQLENIEDTKPPKIDVKALARELTAAEDATFAALGYEERARYERLARAAIGAFS